MFVKPIKERAKIEEIKNLMEADDKIRERALFILGINSGLRISDILNLKWKDVESQNVRVKEQKTGKQKRFPLNASCIEALESLEKGNPEDYIFKSNSNRCGSTGKAWSSAYVWQFMKEYASQVGLDEIGTHTLRKTAAYHIYKNTGNLALVQKMLNHSSSATTLQYIGLEQDDIDSAYTGLNL